MGGGLAARCGVTYAFQASGGPDGSNTAFSATVR
jgi:hypothetical protein